MHFVVLSTLQYLKINFMGYDLEQGKDIYIEIVTVMHVVFIIYNSMRF